MAISDCTEQLQRFQWTAGPEVSHLCANVRPLTNNAQMSLTGQGRKYPDQVHCSDDWHIDWENHAFILCGSVI